MNAENLTTIRLIIILSLICCLLTIIYLNSGAYYAQKTTKAAYLSPEEATKFLLEHKDALVIDVRTKHEYKENELPGSINIPLFQFYSKVSQIPADRPILITDVANIRALQAYKLLRSLRPDIAEVYYVKGRWVKLPGYMLVVPPSFPSP